MRKNSLGLAAVTSAMLLAVAAQSHATVIAYLPMDGDAMDVSGMGNHGVSEGGGTFVSNVPAILGSGMAYSNELGAGQIRIPNSPSLAALDDQVTIAFWVNASPGSGGTQLFQMTGLDPDGTGATNGFNNFKEGSDRSRLFIRTSAGQKAGNRNFIGEDVWHHWAARVDNGNYFVYIDGNQVESSTYAVGGGFANLGDMIITRLRIQDDGSLIDDFVIFDEVLSVAQVQGLADGSISPRDFLATANAVPEPATAALALFGLAGLARRRRRLA